MNDNTISFHRHGGKDWHGDAECPFCENDKLKMRLAEATDRLSTRADNLVRLQRKIDHLEDVLEDYSKLLLNEKKRIAGE